MTPELSPADTVGLPPGTPVYTGREQAAPVHVHALDYDALTYDEIDSLAVDDELARFAETTSPTWLSVGGIHDVETIARIGSLFDLHPLVVEDIVNVDQRPKLDDYGEQLFIVLKLLRYHAETGRLNGGQVSIVLGEHHVLTLEEADEDTFDSLRRDIRESRGIVRRMDADYLAYRLVDLVVDHYFVAIEALGERIEALEEQVISRPSDDLLRSLHRVKRDLLTVRRAVWPLREVVNALTRGDSDLIGRETRIFFRDVYDHVVEVMEVVEANLSVVSGLHDLYLSSVAQRTNEVMKTLTVMASLFTPLTFIAGVYGMNFAYMPELQQTWGYPAALALMGAMALGMFVFLKRKGWV